MTVVAQRRRRKVINWVDFLFYKKTLFSFVNKRSYVFPQNLLVLRVRLPEKTSTSAIDSTPHQHLVHLTKQPLLAVASYEIELSLSSFFKIQNVEKS